MIFFNLEPGLTEQTVHETLDGVPVTLRILWNERFQFWALNLYDRQLEPIITGVRMSRDYPLIGRFNLDALAGDFLFYRLNGSKDEADFDSIGGDYELAYLTQEEMNVIQALV